MGIPSGLACRFNTPAESAPAATACAAAVLQNSRLEILAISISLIEARFTSAGQSSGQTFSALRRFSLKLPAASSFRPDVILQLVRIVDLQACAIPVEFLPEAGRNTPEQQGLRHHALELEIPARLHAASLAGIEPLAFVSRRARKRFRRLLETVHPRLWNQFGMPAVESAQNFAPIPDKEKSLVFFFAIPLERTFGFQLFRALRLESTVVPRELHRRHVAACRKVEAND